MLGFSTGTALRAPSSLTLATAVLLASMLGIGCASSISQDKATGADGKVKGAKKVTLENNEGVARGIVTYPGGDRVDWRLIELPEGKHGTLDVKLKWQAPRPGLDLAFNVYDEWGGKVGGVKPRKSSARTTKTATIPNARGKMYVQIFASNRGDAGKYTLTVAFTEEMGIDPSKLEIPDPPKLPAIPDAPIPCDETTFDKKNPACKNVCPNPPDMAWPACSGKCPVPPDASLPICQQTMPCPGPTALDKRIKACYPLFPECDVNKPDPNNPKCEGITLIVKGRIINVQPTGAGEAIITVNRGSDKGVEQGWKGQVVSSSGSPVNGGAFTVIKVTKREAVGKVKLTTDQLSQNPNVQLTK